MEPPFILLVLGDEFARTEREINTRYGTDYDIVRLATAVEARERLGELRDRGREVALVLAALDLPDGRGEDVLAWTHELQANTKRALLISWSDDDARDRVLHAMSLGKTDSWTYAPIAVRDEQFHRSIAELLEEWDRWSGVDLAEIVVVGPRFSFPCQQIRELLLRTGHPHRWCEAHSAEGQHILRLTGATEADLPVIHLPNDRTLLHPTLNELADVCGVRPQEPRTEYDVAIIGAGPAGLSAATYAASEGLSTALLEQEHVGGQAGSSSLIRNYLGFPRGVSGPELASRALQQSWLFGADLLYGTGATGLELDGKQLVVQRGDMPELRARAAVIATGVQYRQLDVPGMEPLIGAGVFYGSALSAAQSLREQQVFVVGGGNSAGQAALHLAQHDARVTMLVRGPSFAESMSAYLIREIERNRHIEVCFDTMLAEVGGTGRLEWLVHRHCRTGAATKSDAAAVFIFIGMAPRTEWLPPEVQRDAWGFIETGVDGRMALETSMPGVFAVGDVRRGSIKRVASAVGEGSICISAVHDYLESLARG